MLTAPAHPPLPQNSESPHPASPLSSSLPCDERANLNMPPRVHICDPHTCKLPHHSLSRPMDTGEADSPSAFSEGLPRLRNLPSSGTWHSAKCLPPLSMGVERDGRSASWQPGSFFSSLSTAASTRDMQSSNQLELLFDSPTEPAPSRPPYNPEARLHSAQFPPRHQLNAHFVSTYQLEDELGSGGYGFVMTAYHRIEGHEVAVKFIIKDKVPDHAWMEDEVFGRLPTEVVLLSYINHENIVKCLDLFEDSLYFYLVQELHGSPWNKSHKLSSIQPPCLSRPASSTSTPALSPSASEVSLPQSEPSTPPHMFATIRPHVELGLSGSKTAPDEEIPKLLHSSLSLSKPEISRRPSHDLFECIEQSEDKRLTEMQARYVFAQVVDAVHYLDSHGITHRDIKDENLVIDKNLKIKLIDFGSATAVNPAEPRPQYKMFYGTAAYASSEILLKKSYQAPPAEVWTLGVLLSYLLAGISPFPTARDAVDGRIFISEKVGGKYRTWRWISCRNVWIQIPRHARLLLKSRRILG
ncbi:kinase-like domain-containing protein [Pholiota molesta]|nr:kinase-like domain-containing protein [Pholiota molesta]